MTSHNTNTKYRLSIDMGSNSIGWCVLGLDDDGKVAFITDCGVRIFHDSRHGQTKEPLNKARREARLARRTKNRVKARKKMLFRHLQEAGLLPTNKDELNILFNPPAKPTDETVLHYHERTNPYAFRAFALEGKIEPYKLGRALYHIAPRRGFLSNRKEEDKKDNGPFYDRIETLKNHLNNKPLGQFLWETFSEPLRNSNPVGANVTFNDGNSFYPERQMLIDEFEAIRSVQQPHHAVSEQMWDTLYEDIFYQRPLQPVIRGKCRFYDDEERALSILPSAQQFRIAQELNNLTYMHNSKAISLLAAQKRVLFDRLQEQRSLGFNKIRTLLTLPQDYIFNLEDGKRDTLKGNETLYKLHKIDAALTTLPIAILDGIVKEVTDETDKKTLKDYLYKHLNHLDNWQHVIEKLMQTKFDSDGTAAVSLKFIYDINPYLIDDGMIFSKACDAIGIDHSQYDSTGLHYHEDTGHICLPYYGQYLKNSVQELSSQTKKSPTVAPDEADHGRIANPSVHVALNQLRVVVNSLIKRYNNIPPYEVHIELARDIRLSAKERIEVNKTIAANTKNNKHIAAFYQDMFQNPTYKLKRQDKIKYSLWQELGHEQCARSCLYCGAPISAKQMLSADTEIEHILPYARTMDDSMNNKTLVHQTCNRAKGNRSPFEAWGHHDSGQYKYSDIEARVLKVAKHKKHRFLADAMNKYEQDDANNFIARQLNDTKYMARLAKQYLEAICPPNRIVTTNGMLTSMLRGRWQLSRLLPSLRAGMHDGDKKNRGDHRQHAIDAFVIGLCDRWLVQHISAENAKGKDKNSIWVPHLNDGLRQQLQQQLQHMLVSFKPNRLALAQFFEKTAYGLIDKNDDAYKYDNYNLVTRKNIAAISFADILVIRDEKWRETFINFVHNHQLCDFDLYNSKSYTEKRQKQNFDKIKHNFMERYHVKKFRILVKNANATPIKRAKNSKAYTPKSYIYCDIYKVPLKKQGAWVKGQFTHIGCFRNGTETHDAPPKGYHNNAKHIMRVYKEDVLQCTHLETGEITYQLIKGLNASSRRLDIRPLHEADGKEQYKTIHLLFKDYRLHVCQAMADGRYVRLKQQVPPHRKPPCKN